MNNAINQIQRAGGRIREQVKKVIVGKDDVVDLMLVSLFCEGHVLLEDVPGIGKTTLARALSSSLGCVFRRIQFTPDLLPADITGVSIYNQKTQSFDFRPGPIFAQVVLADEINRAGPRTQSALLEAMQERQVTVDGDTRLLKHPFLVMATQNPIELEGTFPLPEAQLDRFLMKLSLGYPSEQEELAILRRFKTDDPLDSVEAVLDPTEIENIITLCRSVYIAPALEDYIVALVTATRTDERLSLGASPRGSLGLYRTAQAKAALEGRAFVLPDDIQSLVQVVLEHRLIASARMHLRNETTADVLEDIISDVPVPVEENWEGGRGA